MLNDDRVVTAVALCRVLLSDVTAGDKATKPQSKLQLHDSGYMQSSSESVLKLIKVCCLLSMQSIRI